MIKRLNADKFNNAVERTCNRLEDFIVYEHHMIGAGIGAGVENLMKTLHEYGHRQLLPLIAQTIADDGENNGDFRQALQGFTSGARIAARKGKTGAVQLFRDWQYARAYKASIRDYEAQLPNAAEKTSPAPKIADGLQPDKLALIGIIIAVAVWVGNGNDIMDLPRTLQAWQDKHPAIKDFVDTLFTEVFALPEPQPQTLEPPGHP